MPDPIRCGRLAVVLLPLCSACDRASITPLPGDPRPGTTSQAAIEAVALDKPFPHYPTRSLENGAAGVAVASIMVGFDGRIERVDVLEAPDADIAEGLRDALERWVLPVHPDGPRRTGATMVFYFLIEAGEGRVVSGLSLAFERTGVLRSVAGEPRRIDEAELQSLLEIGSAVVVVDTRDRELYARDHRDGAINLPLRELQLRAAVELPPAQVVIVDCYRGLEGMCDIAGRILRLVGVPDVAVFVHDFVHD